MRWALAALLLLALCCVGTASAQLCATHCFAGSSVFGAKELTYAFSVLPCVPTVVTAQRFQLGSGVLSARTAASFTCSSNATAPPSVGTNATTNVTAAPPAGVVAYALTIALSASQQLQWLYTAPAAAGYTCAALLPQVDALPLTYVGSNHQFNGATVLDDMNDLGGYAVPCPDAATQQCTAVTYSSGLLVLSGLAQDKSPCGAIGTTTCNMTVLFTTDTNCSAPGIATLDVLIQPGSVLLSAYAGPAAVQSPALACDAAVLSLEAPEVALTWAAPTSNSGDCAALLANLALLATGRITSLTVGVTSTEQWTLAVAAPGVGASIGAGAGATYWPPGSAGGVQTDGSGVVALVNTHIIHPVIPNVVCSMHAGGRLNLPDCCTLFSYTNRNFATVNVAVAKGANWFRPKPFNRGQPTSFLSDVVNADTFCECWACNRYTSPPLVWTVVTHANTPGDHRQWVRSASADAQRADCTEAQLSFFC